MSKSRAIGTRAETAVVRWLQANGWPLAERRALHGALDQGDITGTPGICWEVKGGDEAKDAGDRLIASWLDDTEVERCNADAEIGVLVQQRRGHACPGRWWAWVDTIAIQGVLNGGDWVINHHPDVTTFPVRLRLDDFAWLLRANGWGDPA